MIKIEEVTIHGVREAIRGMRNPMNSWDKADSIYSSEGEMDGVSLGDADYDLMKRLAAGGPVHAKYRRMIAVYMDITAPFYWWKEFDTYKVGTVANSCSTMHKIAAKEFERDDFSHEHLDERALGILDETIKALNDYREAYIGYKKTDSGEKEGPSRKDIWWQMIQLLPSSYNQKRTVMLNYEVLTGIYPMRRDHKLDEWVQFCQWIESLPCSELITGESKKTGC